jgi:PleD family two-component response regulator
MAARRRAGTLGALAPRCDAFLDERVQSVLVNGEVEPVAVRVLIVDDQEPFRMAARMVVEATEGFDVVGEVETGEDAVEAAHTLDPDLVLMDVNCRGSTGSTRRGRSWRDRTAW